MVQSRLANIHATYHVVCVKHKKFTVMINKTE